MFIAEGGGVPAGWGGFQRQGAFQCQLPTPWRGTRKRRRQGGLPTCNGHRWELFGCRGSRCVGGGRSDRPTATAGEEGGFVVCNFDFHYIPSKTASFWWCFKKINLINLVGSSNSPVEPLVQVVQPLVQCYSGPIDWIGSEPLPAGGRTDRSNPILKTMVKIFQIFRQ